MATVKNVFGNYNLTTYSNVANGSSVGTTITLQTGELVILGNLVTVGNTSSVTKTDTDITDNIITLNKGEAGAGITLGNAGITIDRGTSPDVTLRFNEYYQKWQITNDGSTYGNIGAFIGTGFISAIIEDPNPTLGGNLDVNGRTIKTANVIYPHVNLEGNLQLGYSTTIPSSPVANTSIVYTTTPGAGTTGIYVVNQNVIGQELITKQRAIAYSIFL